MAGQPYLDSPSRVEVSSASWTFKCACHFLAELNYLQGGKTKCLVTVWPNSQFTVRSHQQLYCKLLLPMLGVAQDLTKHDNRSVWGYPFWREKKNLWEDWCRVICFMHHFSQWICIVVHHLFKSPGQRIQKYPAAIQQAK